MVDVESFDVEKKQLEIDRTKADNVYTRFDSAETFIGRLKNMLPDIIIGIINTDRLPEKPADVVNFVAKRAVETLMDLFKMSPNLDDVEVRGIIIPVYVGESSYEAYINAHDDYDRRLYSMIYAGKKTLYITSEDDVNTILANHTVISDGREFIRYELREDSAVIVDPDGTLLNATEGLYQVVAYEVEYAIVSKYNDDTCDVLGIDYDTLVSYLTKHAVSLVSVKVSGSGDAVLV